MTTGARPRSDPPPWLVDALLGFAVFAVGALAISADTGRAAPTYPVAYGLATLLGVLVLGRRRYPVGVLVATAVVICVYYTLELPVIGLALPVSVALYSAAAAGRPRWAIGVAAALVAVSTYFRLDEGEDARYLLGYEVVSTVAIMAAAVALGNGAWERRQREEQRRHVDALREQALALEAADRVRRDRAAVARDLHDVVGHHLSVVALHANVAREALDRLGRPGVVRAEGADPLRASGAALHLVSATTTEALRDLRTTVRSLREAEPGPAHDGAQELRADALAQPRVERVGELAETARAAGLDTLVVDEVPTGAVNGIVSATAYRVVQEGLTNVLRHARASRAVVHLAVTDGGLTVEVQDDGQGTDGTDGAHGGDGAGGAEGFGLRGLRERVGVLGGTLEVGPTGSPDGAGDAREAPGAAGGRRAGFRLRARIPLATEDEGRAHPAEVGGR